MRCIALPEKPTNKIYQRACKSGSDMVFYACSMLLSTRSICAWNAQPSSIKRELLAH